MARKTDNKTDQLNVRLRPGVRAAALAASRYENTTLSALIDKFLDEYATRHGFPPKPQETSKRVEEPRLDAG